MSGIYKNKSESKMFIYFQFQYYWNHVRVKRKTDLNVDRKRALFLAAATRYLLGDIGGGANGVMDMDEDLTIALDNQQLYNDLLATANSVRAGLRVSEFSSRMIIIKFSIDTSKLLFFIKNCIPIGNNL